MLHRFSIGLRSGDDGGHTMNFFSLHAHSSQGPNGIFAAWNGALSCMKMILLLKARFFFLYHGSKWAVRNSTYFAEVIWTPWGTLKGLIKSLPMFPAQNITLPSPCWLCSLVGTWLPSTNHPEFHPNGPSSVARHSSVNKTAWKLVIMCFWAHCNHFSLFTLQKLSSIRLYLNDTVCALNHTQVFSQWDDLSSFFWK